ncbi:MAG: dienelactone hydrolase family protein [Acidobacteriota bacterium]
MRTITLQKIALFSALALSLSVPLSAGNSTTTKTFVSGSQSIHVDAYETTAAGSHPAIVFLYGADAMAILPWSYSAIGSWFASQGYNFYIVHYFDRTQTTFGDLLTIIGNFQPWSETISDATTWVASQPGVDPHRIGIMGMSLGGYLAIYQAGHDNRIKALADWYGGLIDPNVKFMPPTLILHGANDPIVPVAEAYKVQALAQTLSAPCQIRVYPGDWHGFSLANEFDAIQRTLTFFGQYLGK